MLRQLSGRFSRSISGNSGRLYSLKIPQDVELPYFAEIPYFLWGNVNYDSEGDCKYPRDRKWTYLSVTNRSTGEMLEIHLDKNTLRISGKNYENQSEDEFSDNIKESLILLARFFEIRCGGKETNPALEEDQLLKLKDRIDMGVCRTECVVDQFERKELDKFNYMCFFGSWKWIGLSASKFTEPVRWLMLSAITGNQLAIRPCLDLFGQRRLTKIELDAFSDLLTDKLRHKHEETYVPDKCDFITWEHELETWYNQLRAEHSCLYDETMA